MKRVTISILQGMLQAGGLVVLVYASVALAVQINLGGDVEYWLSLFIVVGALVYSFSSLKT